VNAPVEMNGRVSRLAELAVRARIHLDIFTFLMSAEKLHEFEDVLAPAWEFFRFDRVVHEWAFYVRIINLLVEKKDTENLPRMLKVAERYAGLNQAIECARAGLSSIEGTRDAVKMIRDNAVAHQNRLLSQPQIYKKASEYSPVSLPALQQLSDVSLDAANILCTAWGLPPKKFEEEPCKQLVSMLNTLRTASLKVPPSIL
jgi:hypothetical protein